MVHNRFLIFLSCLMVLAFLVHGGVPEMLLRASGDMLVLSAFIAGILFTSLFTIPLSMVALAQLATVMSPWTLAFVGALGALMGDLFLFFVVRDRAAADVEHLLSGKIRRQLKALFRHPFLHWLVPVTGALIIASPLPDELGLTLMGITRVRPFVVIPISYAMNFLGIVLLVLSVGGL